MASVQASGALSAHRRSSDDSPSIVQPTLPRTASGSSRGADVRAAGVWFFSLARQELERPNDDDALGSYGAAAQALRQRPWPGPGTHVKVTEFELDAPAAMHAMIAASQKQNHRQPPQRGPNARIKISSALPRAGAINHRDRVAPSPPHSYVARLESQLNTCSALPRQMSPETKSDAQQQRSASVTTTALPGRRPLEGGHSGHRRPSLGRRTSALRVAALTEKWLKSEEEKAAAELADGSTEVCVEKSLLPIPAHWTFPSQAGHSSAKSCVARLREGKFRTSIASAMSNRSRAASVGEERGQEAAHPPWRQRLLAEPIHSYWALKDAALTPVKPTPSSQIPLLGSARMRRENCERRRHSFEYRRLQLQGELEDQLEWRDRCRSVLLRRCNSDNGAATVPADSPSAAPSMSQTAGVNVTRDLLLTDVFGSSPRAPVPWHQRAEAAPLSSPALLSAWSQEAARQAVQQEKHRLVALLQSFVVKCSAAALTLADTEELRAETIRRVWHPKGDADCSRTAFLYREQFLKLLRGRYRLRTSGLHGALDTMCPADIIDALPSKAEASFARFAYDVLPSRTA
ncbi:hypothetical protein LSCM1_01263 [Leishmania martiniquensis]|uniref:Uncharacterized protein n=1 Tax=Leishmania martiniquensis TaxID=1580590 RepID=A0A836FQ96_9TRYP|nr:hypothetical protein LSCM1_01263 [Leishmania martiniquensis]